MPALKHMSTEQHQKPIAYRRKERVLLWKSSDPTWNRYAVCHAWRTGPNYNTKWFESYDQAAAWADELAAKVGGVVQAVRDPVNR